MTYPPPWRRNDHADAAIALMRAHPFGHLMSAHSSLLATRLPFVLDLDEGQPAHLRAHLNAQNPQLDGADGQSVLVSFSGHASYVSPHWRTNLDRAGTIDYEEVQVRGRLRLVDDFDFFTTLINDLAALFEPQYDAVGDYPVWTTDMAPAGYIERLFPAIRAFVIDIDDVRMISKLHQSFPAEDRDAVATHLARADQEGARAIGAKIRRDLNRSD